MRYQPQQEIFVVAFRYPTMDQRMLTYRQPLIHDDNQPTRIYFNKLTVAEHHRVRSEWAAVDSEPTCDGYLLSAEDGKVYSNQYPTASYGQTTDTADRRFFLHLEEKEGVYEKFLADNPDSPLEYNLLTDVIESIMKGIKDLGAIPTEAENYKRAKAKHDQLVVLQARMLLEFTQWFPDYVPTTSWEAPFKGSTLLWPDATIYPKMTKEKLLAIPAEKLAIMFRRCGKIVAVYPDGDLLSIEKEEIVYTHKQGETPEPVSTFCISYKELIGPDAGGTLTYDFWKPEYFSENQPTRALECFLMRLRAETGMRPANLGSSIADIAKWQKHVQNITAEQVKDSLMMHLGLYKLSLLNNATLSLFINEEGAFGVVYRSYEVEAPEGIAVPQRFAVYPQAEKEAIVLSFLNLVKSSQDLTEVTADLLLKYLQSAEGVLKRQEEKAKEAAAAA